MPTPGFVLPAFKRSLYAIALSLTTFVVNAADVTFNVGSSNGSLRPLLGINIGPLPSGKATNADLTAVYRELEVGLVRTHDYYGPLDMATLYPNRSKNPADQSSFNFTAAVSSEGRSSDTTFGAIVNNGFEPFFRLGDSYNNATPPSDSERSNWVQAAVSVLRHYREGQWNGFRSNFRYVEIWNEPDNTQFWPKNYTQSQYLALYEATAKAIRTAFPSIRIGGPGVTPGGCKSAEGQAWVSTFLDYIKSSNSPLDFFSWHIYTIDPGDFSSCAAYFRQELDKRGLTSVNTVLSEWNTPNVTNNATEALDLRANGKGAAILTGGWINLQGRDDVEQALFYRGPDPDVNAPSYYGMYTADGKPKKIGLAAHLWRDITRYSSRLSTSGSLAGMHVLAADNGSGARAILVANTNETTKSWGLSFADGKTLADYTAAMQTVNDASADIQFGSTVNASITIAAKTVQLLQLTPKNQVFNASASATGSTSALSMTGRLTAAAGDVGRPGVVYLAASTPAGWYFHDGLAWKPWSNGTFPAWYNGTLPASFSIPILSGVDVRGLKGTTVYLGYGLSADDMLARKNYGAIYTF